ncbi:LptF/LptG family permease [Chamaesiphon sp. OTE_75_metabat_556]|uniref:LptF/LptG family permease n=1 Tax=Chamaesiphon sp. OTE_75_metabat_556 TaxID=2964692 RepID=UPI00286A7084|nr:LptF/LptG family permease [Chamaesiphon sp. OTE_75_metabat_556]
MGNPSLSRVLLPGISVMDRYIVTQLLMPFLFGVGAFSSIILAVGSLFDLVRQVAEAGLPLTVAIEVMALKLPQYVVYAFPMSILLSGMMTYGSFSASSEIIAFRSCGISVYRLILPALILSFVVTGITFFFNEMLVPAASQRATTTLTRALKQDKPTFNTDNIVKPIFKEIERNGKKEQVLSWLFYAEKFDGKTMSGLTILDRSQVDKGFSQIINAKSAVFDTNKNTWDFENGTIYLIAPDASYRNIVTFEHQQLQLPKSPFEFAAPDKNLDDMSVAESIDYLETVKLSGDSKKMTTVAVTIQRKLAFPFVCIVFSLMGAAMGIRPQRSGKATSFGVSVLLIFGYYLLMFVCAALGQAEIISPFLAGWLPNFIGLAIGGWLIAQVAK